MGDSDNSIFRIHNMIELIKTLVGVNAIGSITVFDLVRCIGCIIGFILLFIAMIRLSKHGKTQQMFRYYAPSTTVLMFISGVMLISMSGFIQMLSATLFQNINMNPISTIGEYVNDASAHANDARTVEVYMIYALLAIISFISLIRGTFLMIQISEGQHEGTLSRVVCHIVAGVIGMNASYVMNILNSIYNVKQYI